MSTHRAHPVILSARAIATLPEDRFPDPTTGGNVSWKTLLSSPRTPTNTLTSGLARCPPRGGQLKCHRHAHAELYHLVRGRGVVTIDGEESEVAAGDVVFIPGDAEHGIRNEEEEEELVWLYVFAADAFEEVVYRFGDGRRAGRAKL